MKNQLYYPPPTEDAIDDDDHNPSVEPRTIDPSERHNCHNSSVPNYEREKKKKKRSNNVTLYFMAALVIGIFNIVFYSTIIKDYDKDVVDKDVSSSLPRAFEDERDASEQDTDNNNSSSSLLHFRKWPLSRMDKVRQDPYMLAPIPSSPSDINDVDCPQSVCFHFGWICPS